MSVSDVLPPGLSLESIDGPGWACTRAVVVCTRPTVEAETDAPAITVTVRVGSGVQDGTTLTNEATGSTSTPGDDPADNTDDATVDVVTSADLEITKTHPIGRVDAGTPVTFDLAVTNHGPSDAQAPITIVDQLPPGMTYVSSSGQWTCTADPADAAGQEVDCELDGDDSLIAGTDAPLLQITVQVAADTDDGVLINSATVSSPTDDPVPGNNTDTDRVNVGTVADVSIVKSHADPAHVGDELSFTLQVRNDGPSEARNVSVSDVLPTGLAYVSADGTDWTCAEATGTITSDSPARWARTLTHRRSLSQCSCSLPPSRLRTTPQM